MAISHSGVYRIIDANFNRAKEGLRVCEDICRFIVDDEQLTRKFKILRHRLTEAMSFLPWGKVIAARNIQEDVGRVSHPLEFKREKIVDIFYANAQRSKESIRVLEEFSKLLNKKIALRIKWLRYQMYALEQKIIKRL